MKYLCLSWERGETILLTGFLIVSPYNTFRGWSNTEYVHNIILIIDDTVQTRSETIAHYFPELHRCLGTSGAD